MSPFRTSSQHSRSATSVDDTARRAGAVNTLVFRDGKISGSNTDGYGFIANLRAHGIEPAAGPALLLGAGGSARAVAAALQDAGAPVAVANRTPERAEALAHDLPGLRILDWDTREAALGRPRASGEHDAARHGRARAAGSGSGACAGPRWPWPTMFMCRWRHRCLRRRARGLRCVDGLGMLLHQAVPGFLSGSGLNRKWTMSYATSSLRTFRCDEDSRPDRRYRHGKIDRSQCFPPCADSRVRCRCSGASDAGAWWPRRARDRGGVSRHGARRRGRSDRVTPCGVGKAGRAHAD